MHSFPPWLLQLRFALVFSLFLFREGGWDLQHDLLGKRRSLVGMRFLSNSIDFEVFGEVLLGERVGGLVAVVCFYELGGLLEDFIQFSL